MDLAKDPSLLAPTSCGDAPCFTHVSPSFLESSFKKMYGPVPPVCHQRILLHFFVIIAQKQQRVDEAVARCTNTIKLQFLQH
jgi:hypothetical protein